MCVLAVPHRYFAQLSQYFKRVSCSFPMEASSFHFHLLLKSNAWICPFEFPCFKTSNFPGRDFVDNTAPFSVMGCYDVSLSLWPIGTRLERLGASH